MAPRSKKLLAIALAVSALFAVVALSFYWRGRHVEEATQAIEEAAEKIEPIKTEAEADIEKATEVGRSGDAVAVRRHLLDTVRADARD